MTNIYQRIDRRLKKIENKTKDVVRKEMIHQRVEEIYRGKDIFEKAKGILKILSA